jgi:hypothetical protein
MEKDRKTTMFDRIRLWWKFEGQYYPFDFIKGIQNLWKWFPVVWKDRDYDDHYIWQVIIFKIKNQAKYIGDRDFHVSAKRDAEIMMTCVRLMEKVSDEYYQMEYMDYCEDKHEFVDSDTPGYSELKTTPISENFDEYFAKRKTSYHRVISNTKTYRPDDRKHTAMSVAYMQHNRARKILFTLLERNIERWWD